MRLRVLISLWVVTIFGLQTVFCQPPGAPAKVVDLAALTAGTPGFSRFYGASGDNRSGDFGLPITGGLDLDGDGFVDFAMSHMPASPAGRIFAGEVDVFFGNGTIGETIDASLLPPRVLRITGDTDWEMLGNEQWMADVTGDGLGDLLLCRQNHDPGGRIGAGALTIIAGSPQLRILANAGQGIDLRSPPAGVHVFTLVGAQPFARLGIWVRSGDVDGDGIDDLVVGSDQESDAMANHHGAAYVLRGGSHLATTAIVDLANFGSTSLVGKLARLTPPSGSDEFHFGATVQMADLDGNGRVEVMGAAAIARTGAVVGPGGDEAHFFLLGAPGGRVYIAWDDNFPSGAWPAGYHIDLASPPGDLTTINGGAQNFTLGEEMIGGLDFNGDGHAEFFVGDLAGDGTPDGSRLFSGVGYVFFHAANLRGLDFNVDNPSPGLLITRILGPSFIAIGSDTAAQGDFNGDGFNDLVTTSPQADPLGRLDTGAIHIIFGQQGLWPQVIDTAPGALPPIGLVRVVEIAGAAGAGPGDEGDILGYSTACGDVNGDGKEDLISNEMAGNGVLPGTIDVGNLIILDGSLVSPAWPPPPPQP